MEHSFTEQEIAWLDQQLAAMAPGLARLREMGKVYDDSRTERSGLSAQ